MRPNPYAIEKRRREIERKKKNEESLQRKLERKKAAENPDTGEQNQDEKQEKDI